MTTTKKNPPIYKLVGWLISLFAFSIGFWHTHLGLREFKVLSSENGSLLVAGIVLLVMILGYAVAVSGRKIGLLFYLICACVFFIFNLNSFYPTYLGRTLVKEETKAINDSITTYKARIDKLVGVSKPELYQNLQDLRTFRSNVLREIKDRGGFGPYATEELRKFNTLAESKISPDRTIDGNDTAKINNKIKFYTTEIDKAIEDYIIKSLPGTTQASLQLIEAQHDMEDIVRMYAAKLEDIIKDNSVINLHTIKTNPQIITLQEVVTKLDNIAIAINSVKQPPQFSLFNKDNQTIYPKTQRLGTFSHTINSVKERIGKTDTLGVIGVCLLIDLLAPLAVYFFIRKKEDEEDDSFIGKFFRKNKNFNK